MVPRVMSTGLSILVLFWIFVGFAMAADTIDGTIEKSGNGMIELKDKSGTVLKYEVDSGAKITLDGKSVKLDELPNGAPATVKTEVKNNKTVAVTITAKSPL